MKNIASIKKLFTYSLIVALVIPVSVNASSLDGAHSAANFSIKHLGFSKVHGNFSDLQATVEYDRKMDKIKSLEASVAVNSVSTGVKRRDNHLQQSEFFDASAHPKLTLKMVSHDKQSLTADVTMKGITKRVKFDMAKGVVKTRNKNVLGMSLEAEINRMDFNVGQGFAAKTISEAVKIELSFEFEI